jgi:Tubulin-tyrosine ligase family
MKYTLSTLIIILLVLILIYFNYNTKIKTTNISNLSYHILDNNQLTLAIKDILYKYNINQLKQDGNGSTAFIRFMNGYNNVENELTTTPDNTYKFIAGIKGMDYIVGKNHLWHVLQQYYPQDKLLTLVPKTYILLTNGGNDISKLLEQTKTNKNKIIVFKKNIQRQEGLLLLYNNEITQDKINKLIQDNFVIAQEYLDNPMTINDLKCNLRIYLLLIIKNGKLQTHVYNDGFMYYSQKKYSYSKDLQVAITTGLQTDRTVYQKNPLTLKDLKIYLGQDKSNILFNNINKLIVDIINGTSSVLSGHSGSVNFSLFGIDVQPDSNLNVKLIEINKSPSLDPKDERDRDLKYNLQEDMLKIVGIINETSKLSAKSNGFYQVI